MSNEQKSETQEVAAPAAEAPKKAKKEKAEKVAAAAPEAPKAAPGKKRVKALKSMSLHDGTQMIAGEHCEITDADHERLSKDARGPFWE